MDAYAEHGLALIFGVVLLQQSGVPIPAYPLLVLAGAYAVAEPAHALWALALSVLASLAGNYAWFLAGRRHGYRVLGAVCRVSLTPDSCVRQTENAFARYGKGTLILARFVPGLGMIAPPLAGAFEFRTTTFLLYNGVGSALWATSGLVPGWIFHAEVEWLLDRVAALGNRAIARVAALVALYVAQRAWRRWRFRKALHAARITAAEVHEIMRRGDDLLVLDVRSRTQRKLDGRRIPGAKAVDLDDIGQALAGIPRDREIIVYCACPNEATAANVAMQLQKGGVTRVRPLAGGIDAWASAGLAIEHAEGDRETPCNG
jgi:membrane protein DedA with SNARE-associated domain/rhodanese-related sulfurtransferase